MKHIFSDLMGTVLIKVSGEGVLRFISLCKRHGIRLFHIKYQSENCLECEIRVKEFKKLIVIRRKTGVHIRICKKQGSLFRIRTLLHRNVLWIGLVIGCIFLFFLSSRIWEIEISGNLRNSEAELHTFLMRNGIKEGMKRKNLNCDDISACIRKNYPDITWVSLEVKGVELKISIKEEISDEILEDTDMNADVSADLIADHDGEIVSIIVRNGTPMVKEGDICKRKDILVSGKIDIKNDDQEVIRTQQVRADADIWVQHIIPYYDEFPLIYFINDSIQKKRNSFQIKFNSRYFDTGIFSDIIEDKKTEGTISINQEITLFPDFLSKYFPFSFYRKMELICYKKKKKYSKKEAYEEAMQRLEEYEKKLIEKGVQISANNVTIKVSDFSCQSRGTITVIEKTGTWQ